MTGRPFHSVPVPRLAPPALDPSAPPSTIDLCARCAVDPTIVDAALTKRLGKDREAVIELHTQPHSSYDFAPRPVPCYACGRILSAEDD